MIEFIFMLTRDDVTVPNARAVFERAAATGVQHVGCKDIGLEASELGRLLQDIRCAGRTSYLEVVSESEEAMLRSAEAAVEAGADYLVGGKVEALADVLEDTDVGFFPYVGRIVDHPCLLRGEIEEIAADAERVTRLGADGINLLAYRYDKDPIELVRAVTSRTSLPVLCAGSIDGPRRIRRLARAGAWGFTVGTAVFEESFKPGAGLEAQLMSILEATASP